jgi:hypothetical protein
MWMWKLFAIITLALAAGVVCSGCPALMIPGLAYSGYQYEHKKSEPASSPSTSSTASTSHSSKSATATRPQKIPDSEIE